MTIFKMYLPSDFPPFCFSLPENIKGKPQRILTNNSWSGLFGSLQYAVKAQSERNARTGLPTFLCYHPSSTWEKRHDVLAKANKHSPAIPFSLSQPTGRRLGLGHLRSAPAFREPTLSWTGPSSSPLRIRGRGERWLRQTAR